MVYPLSISTAFLTLTMAPGNLTQLEELVREKGMDPQDILIPVAAVKLTDKTSKITATATNSEAGELSPWF